MSALDSIVKHAMNYGPVKMGSEALDELSTLRADNARLTARVAELEAAAQDIACDNPACDWPLCVAMRGRVAYQGEHPATLTPRQRQPCLKLAEQMREAAAAFADDFDGDDIGFDIPTSIGAGIRALPFPDIGSEQCGACWPLKPEDRYANYVGYLMTLSDEDRYSEIQKMGDVFCLHCGSRYLPCFCMNDD